MGMTHVSFKFSIPQIISFAVCKTCPWQFMESFWQELFLPHLVKKLISIKFEKPSLLSDLPSKMATLI